METKHVIERYGVYFNYFSKLSTLEKPTIRKLGITPAHLQRAYREMRGHLFHDSILKYLDMIAYEFRLYIVSVRPKLSYDLKDEMEEIFQCRYPDVVFTSLANPRMIAFRNNWAKQYGKTEDNFRQLWHNAILEKIVIKHRDTGG